MSAPIFYRPYPSDPGRACARPYGLDLVFKSWQTAFDIVSSSGLGKITAGDQNPLRQYLVGLHHASRELAQIEPRHCRERIRIEGDRNPVGLAGVPANRGPELRPEEG